MKDEFIAFFSKIGNDLIVSSPKILSALAVFAFFYVCGFFLRRLFKRKIQKRVSNGIVASFAGEILFWVLTIIGILFGARILGFSGFAGSLLAGAGVSAIVFGFAFKDILENFLAGILLAFQKPFNVGDIIQVESFKGPVVALELRSTRMRLADGRDIWIPNAMIIKGVLTNYTRDGLLRHEFIIGLDVESNVDQARNLILDYLDTVSDVLKNPIPNVFLDNINGTGSYMKVLFWINQKSSTFSADPEARGESIKSLIMRGVRDILLRDGFNLSQSFLLVHKMEKPGSPIEVRLQDSSDHSSSVTP